MRKKSRSRYGDEDEPVSLLPVMSLLIILIPFLVGNVAFMHFRSVSVNTPVHSSESKPEEERERNVLVKVKVENKRVFFDIIDQDSAEVIWSRDHSIDDDDTNKRMKSYIDRVVEHYDKFKTILFNVEDDVRYEDLISVLLSISYEEDRLSEDNEDSRSVNIVFLPKGAI